MLIQFISELHVGPDHDFLKRDGTNFDFQQWHPSQDEWSFFLYVFRLRQISLTDFALQYWTVRVEVV